MRQADEPVRQQQPGLPPCKPVPANWLLQLIDHLDRVAVARQPSWSQKCGTVVKMRDGNHTKNLLEVEITESGVSVIGTFSGLTGVLGGNPTLTPPPNDQSPT